MSSSAAARAAAAALAVLSPASSDRRIAPPCWTPDETLALIDSYADKWRSLRRANLRAPHWDDVAAAVASRSRHLPASTPKTPVQCRHKIEKLRRRYRAELRRRPDASSPWPFFLPMHALDDSHARAPSSPDSDSPANTRSIHRLMSNGAGALTPNPHPNPHRYVMKNAAEEMAQSPDWTLSTTLGILTGIHQGEGDLYFTNSLLDEELETMPMVNASSDAKRRDPSVSCCICMPSLVNILACRSN